MAVALFVPEAEYVTLNVPSFGKSSAIAAAPKAMAALSVTADNRHARGCIACSFPSVGGEVLPLRPADLLVRPLNQRGLKLRRRPANYLKGCGKSAIFLMTGSAARSVSLRAGR